MTKDVTVAELAEHLEEHLAEVQRGVTLRVVRGEDTVAEISPARPWVNGLEPLSITHPEPGKTLKNLPPPPKRTSLLDEDPVQWLIDERDRERSGKKYEP